MDALEPRFKTHAFLSVLQPDTSILLHFPILLPIIINNHFVMTLPLNYYSKEIQGSLSRVFELKSQI